MNDRYAPVHGLPGSLPQGERLLWQGSPVLAALARRTLHGRMLAGYFLLLLAWVAVSSLTAGLTPGAAAWHVLRVLPLALAALALVALLAWQIARSTVYTITDRRVVLSFGIALPVKLNLPFARIAAAAVKVFPDGTADIPLALARPDRVAWLMLWPHVRPWRLGRPEPTLRAVPEGAQVAAILSRALAAAAAQPVPAPVATPDGRLTGGPLPSAVAA